MHIEAFRTYCLAKKGVEEDFPFDESILAFKVMGKMFALTNIDAADFTVNLKCTPEYALELREQYNSIIPGYHMNKKYWNTLEIYKNELSNELIKSCIDLSYELVVAKLTKKDKAALAKL